MEDQASALQLDMKDNGLSHNGNNIEKMDVTEAAATIQSQKVVENPIEVEAPNGINLLDDATSTTTEPITDQIAVDPIKKMQNSSNGVNPSTETSSIDNHQDDDLIRELAQFEGVKKDEDVTLNNLAKTTSDENGGDLQDTSDLLKDLESDSPGPSGPSESEIENAAVDDSTKVKDSVEVMDVDQTVDKTDNKTDDVQVDSTTESSQKRKHSTDTSVDNAPAKRANLEDDTEKAIVAKPPSEIDSDTESKLLHENSDGEASMSDVVEAITSTSTDTKSTSDAKPVDDVKPSNEDIEVSSSDSVEVVPANVDAVKEADVAAVSKVDTVGVTVVSAESKSEVEVTSNKVNDTTEIMEQDLNETVEMDSIADNKPLDKVTSISDTSNKTIEDESSKVSNSSPEKNTQSEKLAKAEVNVSETDDTSVCEKAQQSDTVASNEPKPSQMEIDNESEPQSSDDLTVNAKTKKFNGLSGRSEDETQVDSKVTAVSLPESSSADSDKPNESIGTYEIRLQYDGIELKSLYVERLEKKKLNETSGLADNTSDKPAEIPSESTKHTALGMVELCNFIINHFGAIKKSLNVDDGSTSDLNDSTSSSNKTSAQRGRGSSKKSTSQAASPNQVTPKSSGKRATAAKRSFDKTDIDESESKSKQAKNSNKSDKSVDDDDEEEEEVKGDCCLARWTDRKYYAGRVVEEKPGNKFVVLFEDGASKVLAQEVIVFGTGNVLPLMDHSVHVLVSDDTYEPGRVTKIDTEGETVQYTVEAESKTVTCSASDLYLMEDQAKLINNSMKGKEGTTPETPTSKRTGRLPAKLEETVTSISGGRSSRGKKVQAVLSPEPGFSGDADVKKTGRRSTKRRAPPRSRVSEGSDFSDSIVEKSRSNSPELPLEGISGVQPELQSTHKDSEIFKQNLIAEYLGNDSLRDFEDLRDDLLGPMPRKKTLFRGKHFLLTCTIPIKEPRSVEVNNGTEFGTTPFYKEHLSQQIEMGGGTVYSFFEDIPKAQYKNCKLIAHHPCITAKFVQCLAANITPLSHEWIIDCCANNEIVDIKPYILPCGWSIVDNQYKEWVVSRSKYSRNNIQPLKNFTVLMGSHNQEFSDFWQRVCKLAGANIRAIKSLSDITKTTKGIMLTDEDFSEEIKLKAEHFKIPVVSTVWVVQSLILGEPCDPEANIKLKQVYVDDDY